MIKNRLYCIEIRDHNGYVWDVLAARSMEQLSALVWRAGYRNPLPYARYFREGWL